MKFLLLFSLCLAQGAAQRAPEQPLPYSHKTHLAQGLKCADCHTNADPGESMGFPANAKCMACHIAVAKDKPSIVKLTAAAKAKQVIPWARVYEIPSYVAFSHRTHMQAGAKCENCHGDVSKLDVMVKQADLSMGGCMECHRQHKASTDCSFCHDPR